MQTNSCVYYKYFFQILFRDPNIDLNGEITSSKWPLYTKPTREYKELDAAIMHEEESLKSGSLRAQSCALWDWYIPRVEGK